MVNPRKNKRPGRMFIRVIRCLLVSIGLTTMNISGAIKTLIEQVSRMCVRGWLVHAITKYSTERQSASHLINWTNTSWLNAVRFGPVHEMRLYQAQSLIICCEARHKLIVRQTTLFCARFVDQIRLLFCTLSVSQSVSQGMWVNK